MNIIATAKIIATIVRFLLDTGCLPPTVAVEAELYPSGPDGHAPRVVPLFVSSAWSSSRLHLTVDERQLADHRLGERERIQVVAAHAAIDRVQRIGQRQPLTQQFAEAVVAGVRWGHRRELVAGHAGAHRPRPGDHHAVLAGGLERVA